MGDRLVGVLLASFDGEPKVYTSIWHQVFLRIAEFVINTGYSSASDTYDESNQSLLAAYKKDRRPDGELCFFAVDPSISGKGIGSLLLNHLASIAAQKEIYLFSDSGSTYQFYLKRGFEMVGKQDVVLDIDGTDLPLTCMLFSKTL